MMYKFERNLRRIKLHKLWEDNTVRRRQPHLNSNFKLVFVKSKVKVFVYGRQGQQQQHQGYENSTPNIYVLAN